QKRRCCDAQERLRYNRSLGEIVEDEGRGPDGGNEKGDCLTLEGPVRPRQRVADQRDDEDRQNGRKNHRHDSDLPPPCDPAQERQEKAITWPIFDCLTSFASWRSHHAGDSSKTPFGTGVWALN